MALQFDGTSQGIDGYVYWEGDGPISKAAILFAVDMSTFDTGIGKRDHDMRIVLNTRKWPQAHQRNLAIRPDTSATNTYQTQLRHFFTTWDRAIGWDSATITVGTAAYIGADFTIRLQDYDIEAPLRRLYKGQRRGFHIRAGPYETDPARERVTIMFKNILPTFFLFR